MNGIGIHFTSVTNSKQLPSLPKFIKILNRLLMHQNYDTQ